MSGGGGRSKSSSSPKLVPFDKKFRDLQAIGTEFFREALGATREQRDFQTALFDVLGPEFGRFLHSSGQAFDAEQARLRFLQSTTEGARQVNDAFARQVGSLGQLTPEEDRLISSATRNARDVGQENIRQFVAENFRGADELAASRGLRPTDAPIGNVRGRVGEEATRQAGQLEREIAAQDASLRLNVPLQRASVLSNAAGASNAFQAALQQNANANRLNLASTIGQLGLGLSGFGQTGSGLLGASRPAFGTESSSKSTSVNFGISHSALKHEKSSIDAAEVLARLQALSIEKWRYLWESGSDAMHIGPYAEEFSALFEGDGVTIDYGTALGVAMVSIQELTKRLQRIESTLAIGGA